ncbi:MAG: hypothetical protein ILO68_06855 [Clostridia bacterium]|nr:hypothetical protein [Clostridia bacterium]
MHSFSFRIRNRAMCLVLLALLLILPLIAACGTETPGTSSEAEPVSAAEPSKEESVATEPTDLYKGDDFTGRTFTILTSDVDTDPMSEIVYNEEGAHEATTPMPEKLNVSLKARMDNLEKRLGVTLKETYLYDSRRYGGTTITYIRNAITTALDEFQAIDISLYDCGTLSLENALYNLHYVDNFNPKHPWWDQGFNDSVEIAGKLFFTTGDIDFRNKSATTCLLFNAGLFERLGLEDPYELVASGDWTIDKVMELAKNYSEDMDQDDRITWHDRFGWAGQYDDMYAFLYGSGVRIVSPDANGYPSMSFYNEKTVEVVEKILNFMQEKDYYICGNDMFNEFQWPMIPLMEDFAAGQCLFFAGVVENIFEIKDAVDEFGIAPSPKYNKEQDSYYSLLNTWAANAMAIPTNVTEDELPFVGACLDVLGYLSWKNLEDSVAYNYYDVVLKYQKLTTEKASLLLDEIFAVRGCELGAIYQVGIYGAGGGTVYDMLINMMDNDMTTGLTAKYDERKSQFQESIDAIRT